MPRLLGVEIPGNKRVAFALRYIYGIGPKLAEDVVTESGIDPARRAHELSEEELNKFAQIIIAKGWLVEGDLRRDLSANLKRLQAIKSYRGLRHARGLPVRGQKTQTNARTRKGGRKTVGVVRKK